MTSLKAIRRGESGKLLNRVIRAARLDVSLYREVRDDVTATKQALAVVALVAIAHGAAGMIRTVSFGWGDPVIGSLFGVLGEISFFLGASLVIYLLGKFVFGAKATYAQVLRPFGFSVVPGLLIVIAALASLPEIFGDQAPVLILLIAWRLAAGYVAVWQALSLGTLRSIVILLAGALSGMWAVVTATSILFDILP
jgi:hypothetical protein